MKSLQNSSTQSPKNTPISIQHEIKRSTMTAIGENNERSELLHSWMKFPHLFFPFTEIEKDKREGIIASLNSNREISFAHISNENTLIVGIKLDKVINTYSMYLSIFSGISLMYFEEKLGIIPNPLFLMHPCDFMTTRLQTVYFNDNVQPLDSRRYNINGIKEEEEHSLNQANIINVEVFPEGGYKDNRYKLMQFFIRLHILRKIPYSTSLQILFEWNTKNTPPFSTLEINDHFKRIWDTNQQLLQQITKGK